MSSSEPITGRTRIASLSLAWTHPVISDEVDAGASTTTAMGHVLRKLSLTFEAGEGASSEILRARPPHTL